MMGGDRGISAFPDGDKLFSWIATVEGPQGTAYEGNWSFYGVHFVEVIYTNILL